MSDTEYSSELTAEEQKLGFQLMDVKNPRSEFMFEPSKVQAVVKVLGPSDRIIKMNVPGGGCSFKHQRYGHFGTRRGHSVDWLPVGSMAYPTASQAVKFIESRRAEQLESQGGISPIITPVDPGDDF